MEVSVENVTKIHSKANRKFEQPKRGRGWAKGGVRRWE